MNDYISKPISFDVSVKALKVASPETAPRVNPA
jgi:hypothetical protein